MNSMRYNGIPNEKIGKETQVPEALSVEKYIQVFLSFIDIHQDELQ